MSAGENITDVAEAERLLDALVLNARQQGHVDPLASVAAKVGASRWAIWGFTKGRRKAIGSGLLASIRKAYLDLCMRQVRHLEAEMADLRQRCGEDDFVTSIGAETQRLVEKIRQARERAR